MRIRWLASLVLCLLFLLPGAAQAKLYDVDRIVITGPGRDRAVFSRDEFFARRTNSYGTAYLLGSLFQESQVKRPLLLEPLGPRYVLEYHLRFIFGRPRTLTVVQHLYPFAAAGPVAFTVADDVDIDFPKRVDIDLDVPGDWIEFPEGQLRKMQRMGFQPRHLRYRRDGQPFPVPAPPPW